MSEVGPHPSRPTPNSPEAEVVDSYHTYIVKNEFKRSFWMNKEGKTDHILIRSQ